MKTPENITKDANLVAWMTRMEDKLDRALNLATQNNESLAKISDERAEFVTQKYFNIFIEKDYKPIVDRVSAIENWKIKMATISAMIGSAMGFIIPYLMKHLP